MNPDPMPSGVRWAVRILRLTGWLMLVPACILVPFVLLICLSLGINGQLNAWQIDGIGLLAGFPVILGKSVLIACECLDRAHSVGRACFNPAHEWKKLVDIASHGISVIAYVGLVICLAELVFGNLMNPPVAGNWMTLAFHLALAVASYSAPSRLTRFLLKDSTIGSD
jgi:hypothetical protein